MLHGALVTLQARREADVAILDAELHGDVPQSSRASRRPWQPISPGSSSSHFAISDPNDRFAPFSVVTIDGDELAGDASLWGIDMFNRMAHIGIGLLPAYQGKGLGTDAVAVLCHYGFVVLGLHRLQIETLVDNDAMIKSAEHNGFTTEGVIRENSWVMGTFADETILGLLATDWTRRHDES